QIELLKTFADQAVIAIENVRLVQELRARTDELTRSVDQLRALGDVGRAVSSTLDLETVLTTIVSRPNQLAGTDACSGFEDDEIREEFHLRTTHNLDPLLVEPMRAQPVRRGEGMLGRLPDARRPLQIPDIAAPGAYEGRFKHALLGAGRRALLAIP